MPFWILHLLITNRTISLMVVRKQFICSAARAGVHVYKSLSWAVHCITPAPPVRPWDRPAEAAPGAKVRILNKLNNFLYTLGATLKRNIFWVYCQWYLFVLTRADCTMISDISESNKVNALLETEKIRENCTDCVHVQSGKLSLWKACSSLLSNNKNLGILKFWPCQV